MKISQKHAILIISVEAVWCIKTAEWIGRQELETAILC